MRTKIAVMMLALLVLLAMPNPAAAQQADPWAALQQVRADLRADRQAVVAANLPLTAAEGSAFWPLYKEYRGELQKLGDRFAKLIMAYAANIESMNDVKAEAFFNEWLAVNREQVAVREKFVPRMKKAIGAAKAARYFQIENKIDAVVNLEVVAEIPLVPIKKR